MFKHKTILSAAIAAALLLNGCSWSPPKTIYPDGSTRVPANSPQKTVELQTAREKNRSMLAENDTLRAQIAVMQKQIDDILAAVSGVLAVSSDTKQPTKPALPQAPLTTPSDTDSGATQPAPQGTLSLDKDASWHSPQNGWSAKNAVLFTKTFATGETNIPLSQTNTSMLYKLGSVAGAIEIRGNTDSHVADAANKKVALQRALNARTLLVDLGIDAGKIRTRFSPSGNFASPNDTESGRSKNRRVDIMFFAKV